MKPIAVLTVDSNAYGPFYCQGCEEEIEEMVLVDSGDFLCTLCGAPASGEVMPVFHTAKAAPKGLKVPYRPR